MAVFFFIWRCVIVVISSFFFFKSVFMSIIHDGVVD